MNYILVQVTGYLASALLAVSLLVNNDLKFRWLNTFGCVFFIVYGLLIHALPIMFTNSILLLINLFYLVKIHRTSEDFDLLEFKEDDQIIAKFLSYYAADIHTYFPDFKMEYNENDIRFIVLRDMAVANIFVAGITMQGKGIVKINYTVPKYRDYKVGRFIFEKCDKFLHSKGIDQLVYNKVDNKQHESFLKVMKFKKTMIEGKDGYVKKL